MGTKLIKYRLFWLLGLLLLLSSCSLTRFVPEDRLLLKQDAQFTGNEALSADKLLEVVDTKANRKTLGSRFYLRAYNLGERLKKPEKERGIRHWMVNQLVRIGEAPRMLDTLQVQEDVLNLRRTYFANGYFYPKIEYKLDTIWKKRGLEKDSLGQEVPEAQKVSVQFNIQEGTAYQYENVAFSFPEMEDSALFRNYDAKVSLIQTGQNYSHDVMKAERNRATETLRNKGYFDFSPNQISFEVDTTGLAQFTPPDSGIAPTKPIDVNVMVEGNPAPYLIKRVKMIVYPPGGKSQVQAQDMVQIPAFAVPDAMRDSLSLSARMLRNGWPLSFDIARSHLNRLNLNFLAERVMLRQGERYSRDNNRQTQQRLQELGMFRFVLVNVKPISGADELEVIIEMQMAKKYQIRFGTEGFSNDLITSNLPGIGTNLVLRDRNTFHKSEFLEFSLLANTGLYAPIDPEKNRAPFFEFGASATLNFHRFLLPFPTKRDFSRFSPYTTLAVSYNQDQRNEYDRIILRGKLSYRWNHIPFSDEAVSRFTPFFFDLIDVRRIDPSFDSTIQTLPPIFQRDYQRRFGSRLQYSYTHQNYGKTRAHPTYWYQASFESGGSLPYFLDLFDFTGDGNHSDNLLFGNIFYAQYLKASFETKFLIPIDQSSEIVLRGIVGGSYTYNNTPSVPYESRFFSGGTSSMRGWLSNTLGPGRTKLTDFLNGTDQTNVNYSLIAPGGEWILELNAEYRFDVWTYLEMALFTDAGNVWFHDSPRIREQLGTTSIINIDNLRLGWDVGIGFRFDLSFLIFRVDLAQQLYAPDLEKGWVLGNPDAAGVNRRNQVQIGINYPF